MERKLSEKELEEIQGAEKMSEEAKRIHKECQENQVGLREDICECGHHAKFHMDGGLIYEYPDKKPNSYCHVHKCKCEKFKPAQEKSVLYDFKHPKEKEVGKNA